MKAGRMARIGLAGMLLLGLGAGQSHADDYWWSDPGVANGRAGDGVWDTTTLNWTSEGTTTGAETFFTWRSDQRARFEAGTVTVTLGDDIEFTDNGYMTIRTSCTITSPKDVDGNYLYSMNFNTGTLRDINVINPSNAQMDVPLTGDDLYFSFRYGCDLTVAAPIFGATTALRTDILSTTSVGGCDLYLTATNTYGGAATIAGRVNTSVTNEFRVVLSGSLANSKITLENAGVLQGLDADNRGLLNFNIAGDTADRIDIYTDSRLELADLNLKLNLSGLQTQTEYVLADYSFGGQYTGTAFASVTGLDEGWSIEYAGTATNPDAIVLVIPEPGTLGLLALGALGFWGWRRRWVAGA
ncbi:MAG: PEP-CTERM sorting domain-containing protein [Candidatus Marinimicrobia bacterium]|nr:PEP-CTERM sorting domain-containing protein [Candidatus Neomarinimicrobiota bacterium]